MEIEVCDYRYDEGLRIRKNGLCPTIKARAGGADIANIPMVIEHETEEKVIKVGGLFGEHQAGSVYDPDGLCPTITCPGGVQTTDDNRKR